MITFSRYQLAYAYMCVNWHNVEHIPNFTPQQFGCDVPTSAYFNLIFHCFASFPYYRRKFISLAHTHMAMGIGMWKSTKQVSASNNLARMFVAQENGFF